MAFTRRHIFLSLIWKYLEQCSLQVVQFVISIVLARLLMPDDFGVIALVSIFISIAGVFIGSGLPAALIQKKDADALDFSSVFWLSICIAFFIYTALFFATPLIAAFYEKQILVSIIRIIGLFLFLNVFISMQGVVVAKKLWFKKMFYRTLIVSIPTGFFGIFLAYKGFGVWALVWQQIFNAILAFIFMQFVVKWKPTFAFSFSRVKSLFNFGWKLLMSTLINLIFGNLHKLIIGKYFSSAMLGFCDKGESFPKLIITNIDASIQAVMFPTFAEFQNDREKLKQMFRRSITFSSFVIFPIMALLAVVAEPTVRLILGEKWLPCVIFMQIFCFLYALWPIHSNNLTVMKALGRSDLFLKLEIIKGLLGVLLVLVGLIVFKSIYALVGAVAVSSLLCVFINAYPNKKLLNYGYWEQMKDVLPYFMLSILVGILVFPMAYIHIHDVVLIATQVLLGGSLYLLISKIMKMDSFEYAWQLLKKIR